MASLSCSFVTFSNKCCDISKHFPGVTEYFPLTSYHKDITAHLRAVNVSQTSILKEKDLTLARSGHFEEEGLNMAVLIPLGAGNEARFLTPFITS